MKESRKMEMREKLLSSPAVTTEIPKHNTKKRTVTVLLVAAIVSVMGISVYAAIKGLEAMSFGRSSWGPSIEEDIKNSVPPREFISLQGYADTPEYKATDEWLKFEESYNRTHRDLMTASDEEIRRTGVDPFEKYGVYTVYSQEMADKLEEIAAKYNLKLRTEIDDCNEKILKKKGINLFFSSGSGDGWMFDDGSFHLDSIYSGIHFQLIRNMRGYFDATYLNIKDKQDYEEWNYKTKSGVTVTIAYNNKGGEFKKAIITANLEKSFVTVNVLPWSDDQELNNLTKADIEKLADEINFAVLG